MPPRPRRLAPRRVASYMGTGSPHLEKGALPPQAILARGSSRLQVPGLRRTRMRMPLSLRLLRRLTPSLPQCPLHAVVLPRSQIDLLVHLMWPTRPTKYQRPPRSSPLKLNLGPRMPNLQNPLIPLRDLLSLHVAVLFPCQTHPRQVPRLRLLHLSLLLPSK